MDLKGKTILILSPQKWGNMFLAKHHYAIELARNGNYVYFLNPPQIEIRKGTVVVKSSTESNLFLINHSLRFSYKIKFRCIWLFHFFMRFHIKEIEAVISKKIDIVWSFDLGNYYPFKYFSADSLKLFNPIDEPLNKAGIESANGCDVIFSVTKEILKKYQHLNVPMHFLHHGLAEEFVNIRAATQKADEKIRVGLSGNWLRTDLDSNCLLKIINENTEVIFEFWGSYKLEQSNIGGGTNSEVEQLIYELQQAKNVILHGVADTQKLAKEFQRMDAFLICYDILKDQSRGTNYHKVMEYLSTGKVIISNNISTYKGLPDMVTMVQSRINNHELPQLFKTVIANLDQYNHPQIVAARKKFAASNLYRLKIAEVQTLLKEIPNE
jgi:hypothetical protein